jgi:hypothetical protein
MRSFAFCFSAALLFLSCQGKGPGESAAGPEEFVFGKFACFCAGQCMTAYRLADGQLVRGTSKCSPEELTYESSPLPAAGLTLAEELYKALPAELLSACNQTFGCPDCADQGGYYLSVKKNGSVCFWRLDKPDFNLPPEFHPLAAKIEQTMAGLE